MLLLKLKVIFLTLTPTHDSLSFLYSFFSSLLLPGHLWFLSLVYSPTSSLSFPPPHLLKRSLFLLCLFFLFQVNAVDPEQHGFEGHGSTYTQVFFKMYSNIFIFLVIFLNNIFFPLAYFIVRIQDVIHITC